MNVKNVAYLDTFGAEHIPKEIIKYIGKNNKYL